MLPYTMSRNIWKEVDKHLFGFGGEPLESIDRDEVEEPDYYLDYSGERADRHGWLQDYFVKFARREDLDLGLWDQVFDILRSHFSRLPTKGAFDEMQYELAEEFLKWLSAHSQYPILEIDTGLEKPWAIGYLLVPSAVSEHWVTCWRGKVVHLERVAYLEANETQIEHQIGEKHV